ncbi:MAG: hypothetical protein AABP62_06530 [Planctomycetota bacterium]
MKRFFRMVYRNTGLGGVIVVIAAMIPGCVLLIRIPHALWGDSYEHADRLSRSGHHADAVMIYERMAKRAVTDSLADRMTRLICGYGKCNCRIEMGDHVQAADDLANTMREDESLRMAFPGFLPIRSVSDGQFGTTRETHSRGETNRSTGEGD